MISCFQSCDIISFFIVAKCDLVHNVKTKHDLCQLLTVSGSPFRNMSNTQEFPEHITLISAKMLLAVNEGEI